MLPTPSTSHVNFERIYEPAEDSYLLLDTLSSPSEKEFLRSRFPSSSAGVSTQELGALSSIPNRISKSTSSSDLTHSHTPLVLEVGTGSGVVLSFIHANASVIFGRNDILTLGVDVNLFACKATGQTIFIAEKDFPASPEEGLQHGFYLGNVLGDLTTSFRPQQIDVLVFNPPYVPTATLPHLPERSFGESAGAGKGSSGTTYEEDSHLLELSYAGGADGMETTDRLLDSLPQILSGRGCAYVLLCAQNRPLDVIERIRAWDGSGQGIWRAEQVGSSGKKAGWEKLVIVRIWREESKEGRSR